MKVYLVRTHHIATIDNPNFAGQEDIVVTGKGDRMVAHEGSHAEATYTYLPFHPYLAREYGFKTVGAAKNSYAYKHPENSKNWNSTVEVIAAEV